MKFHIPLSSHSTKELYTLSALQVVPLWILYFKWLTLPNPLKQKHKWAFLRGMIIPFEIVKAHS